MNTLVQSVIDKELQNFKTFEDNELSSLDNDSVFLLRDSGGIRVISKPGLDQGTLYRLQLLMPYVGPSMNKYVPVNNGILLYLGDLLSISHNKNFPVLCMCKTKDTNGVLIPNIDFFTRILFHNLNLAKRDIEFKKKNNSSIFIGASTGSLENNTRVKYSISCIGNSKHKGYICPLLQHTDSEWTERYPLVKNVLHDSISVNDQLEHKILVNIDGNTLCWSRLYWQMMSNSIPVYINPSKNHFQLFDHLPNKNCYIKSSLDDCFSVYEYIFDPKNLDHVSELINNGKNYCDSLFSDFLTNPDQFLHSVMDYTISNLFVKI